MKQSRETMLALEISKRIQNAREAIKNKLSKQPPFMTVKGGG